MKICSRLLFALRLDWYLPNSGLGKMSWVAQKTVKKNDLELLLSLFLHALTSLDRS